ncbi:MAG: carbohydrate-binding domain-containing protein [Clostridia bacterium]|nr:carbohydrate-binding domain-containing protein [Clostridia bacterium]
MKRLTIFAVLFSVLIVFTACTAEQAEPEAAPVTTSVPETTQATVVDDGIVDISLGDNEILVEGMVADSDTSSEVYIAKDIVYYEEGKDFTYGEGDESEAHSKAEAEDHTVVHITQPGEYRLSGKLSKGQVAVDLGEDAEKNPEAVVTLILDGVDITCDVAPGVIFYSVYECSDADEENATNDVDTSEAGANVIIADGSVNTVNGSYVAKIYKPESVVLDESGTEVEDASKLHKYDGAFYSKMSMNINGGEEGTGVLNINADNEGLDSELHLTVNGGIININSGNDGINTNEDYVSVTTINGGTVNIVVNGETGEGDGIDSNGWLVINGGNVKAEACSFSADAGIDSDMGIHINGGTVVASGSMLDRIEDGGQTNVTFNFIEKQGGETLTAKNSSGEEIADIELVNDCSMVLYSSPDLSSDETYALYIADELIAESDSGFMGGPGAMMHPGGEMPPEDEPPHWN